MDATDARREAQRTQAILTVMAAMALIMGATVFPMLLDVATLCCGFIAGKTLAKRSESDEVKPQQRELPVEKKETTKKSPELLEMEKVAMAKGLLGVEDPPVALSLKSYAGTLLGREDRDLAWAQEKMTNATAWRESFDGDGTVAPALVQLLKKRRNLSKRREPLLSEESLKNAGRVLRAGFLYWKGLDKQGRPVIWNHSGGFDFRDLESEDDFIRAVATCIEVGVLATDDVDQGRLTYVECTDGLNVANFPLGPAWRVLRGVITGFIQGFPERGATFLIAPTTFVNQILFALASPVLPKSLATRIQLVDDASARENVADLLGDPDAVPTFFGGPLTHSLPRDAHGDLDLVTMLKDLLKAKDLQRRGRRRLSLRRSRSSSFGRASSFDHGPPPPPS